MENKNYKEEIKIEAGVKYLVKTTYHPEMEGKQVYANYDLKHNISWFNLTGNIFGWIYGLLTLAFLSKKNRRIFKLGKIWMPPVYAKGYSTSEWLEVE